MDKSKVIFSIHHLIVDDKLFTIETFDHLPEITKDPLIIKGEVVSVRGFKKYIFENRFIGLYFEDGEKYPYSKTVIKTSGKTLEEIPNPKDVDEIELNNQFFVLLDSSSQLLYTSSYKKTNQLIKWISDEIHLPIITKPLFQEQEFIERIKSVSEISFTVVPDLFNQYNPQLLSAKLTEDIYGYAADEAVLTLKYKKKHLTDKVKVIVEKILNRRSDYRRLTIVGKSVDGFDSVFNLEGIVNKIDINIELNQEKKINSELLFDELIAKIKIYEKTK